MLKPIYEFIKALVTAYEKDSFDEFRILDEIFDRL